MYDVIIIGSGFGGLTVGTIGILPSNYMGRFFQCMMS
jgi:hypothetical protein